MHPDRTILHADLDAFFASVEQLDDPELRGKPVLVGGSGPRGVVAAASYEAREFGCRSAMPTAVARRLCPHAIIVKGHFDRYKELSRKVFDVFERYTPLVQPLSIDEAFLDATGSVRLFGSGRAIGERIRADVRTETGLTVSVGVAPNKFLAKLISETAKPDGIAEIRAEDVDRTLAPMKVGAIFGVGPSAQDRLARLGVRTIGDLRALPEEALRAALGSFGESVARLARGIDERPVRTDREAKSISHERTFGVNLESREEVRAIVLRQADDVARRLRRHERLAKTVQLKIRYGDFETITRAESLDDATDSTETIAATAGAIFDAWTKKEGFKPIRLIGVGVSHLTGASERQLGLFTQERDERVVAIDRTTDTIVDRFGKGAIRRASAFDDKRDRR